MITEEELLDIYEKIPHVKCVPGCSACCGPIVVGKTELTRIKKWLKERGMKLKPLHKDLTCGYAKNGRCMIYGVRPLLCRLFGAVRDEPRLKCKFVELPENAISAEQANEMMVKVYSK